MSHYSRSRECTQHGFRVSRVAHCGIGTGLTTWSASTIVSALRSLVPEDQALVYQVAVDFRECLDTSSLRIPVSLLCAAAHRQGAQSSSILSECR
jgi:hypothetical protein